MRIPESLRAPARDLPYALWLPPYLLCFWLLEHLVTADYRPTQLPIDGLIPFWEGFVVFYCLWYPKHSTTVLIR